MATGKMSASTNLYSGPGTTYDRDNLISSGTNVSVLWREGTYFYIEVNLSGLRQGYVPTGTVTGVTTGSVPTYTPSLALRYVHQDCISFMGPGTNYVPSQDNFSILDRIYYVEGRKQGDFALVEFTSRTTGNRKRAWVQHMKLGTSNPGIPYGRHLYTAERIINAAGDRWYLGRKWNDTNSTDLGHLAIDIQRFNGSNKIKYKDIYSIADGTVVEVNNNNASGANGNYVVIQHSINGKTYYSQYCHLSIAFQKTSVLAGEAIGLMGETGRVGTEHVHLCISKHNKGKGNYGYYYTNPSDPNRVSSTFRETGPGYLDWNNTRYYNPTKYFAEGPSFISNNY